MRNRNIFILVILLLIDSVLVFMAVRAYQNRKQPPIAPIVESKPTATEIMAKWNNFSSIPTINDCYVRSVNTCFPSISATNGEDGKPTSLTIKKTESDLSIETARLIIAGDPVFKDYFQSGRGDDPNARGLIADVFMGPSTQNGINPVISLEIAKAVLSRDLPNFKGSQGLMNSETPSIEIALQLSDLATHIPSSVFGYLSIYSGVKEAMTGNPTYQGLGDRREIVDVLYDNLLLTPAQKSLVTYFVLNGDINMYEKFVTSASRFDTLREGTFQTSIVDQSALGVNRSERSVEIIFCNLRPLTGMRCLFANETNLFCSDEKLDTICNGSYTLAK